MQNLETIAVAIISLVYGGFAGIMGVLGAQDDEEQRIQIPSGVKNSFFGIPKKWLFALVGFVFYFVLVGLVIVATRPL